ncbi:MAG: hydroxyisourate hydrolase [Chloroflexota bacterium]
MKSPITTHILDTSVGKPAAGIVVNLFRKDNEIGWEKIGSGTTNSDGRITDLLPPGPLQIAEYKIVFEVGPYFAKQAIDGFYPYVPIIFQIKETNEHYHVPLLLNPFGFSTYRGS